MKKQKDEGPWDYYYDKQLEVLVLEMEFDFEKISRTMNNITQSTNFNPDACR